MRVLVVGSINVDLYQRLDGGSATFGTSKISIEPIKGMTLPSASFVNHAEVAKNFASAGMRCEAGSEEALVLSMAGPFTQKTGGKGANAAAAAGQTFACEFIGNFGAASATENAALRADLSTYGNVDVSRCATLADAPTGTAYILLFADNDNAILLIGGANQLWPAPAKLREGAEGAALRSAIGESVCLMLQREVPSAVNVAAASLAREQNKPVFMDVGGTDAPLDEALMPHVSVIAPNESELTFIAGVATQDAEGNVVLAQVRKAVAALKAKFAACGNGSVEVLVTLGASGSCHFGAAWEEGSAPQHECRVGRFGLATADGKPKDTTGAGDCYRGSYVGARYGEGKSIDDAMRWAAAAGSLSVEVEGAMPSMPTRAAIEERLKQPMLALAD